MAKYDTELAHKFMTYIEGAGTYGLNGWGILTTGIYDAMGGAF